MHVSLFILLLFYPTKVLCPKCFVSEIPPDLTVSATCSQERAEHCIVSCINNGTVLWKRPLLCLRNQKWSPVPVCKKSVSVAHRTQCEGTGFLGRKYRLCFVSVEKKKCPPLLNMTMDLSKCSRDLNTQCLVTCGQERSDKLTCLENGEWSHMPDCGPTGPIKCPEPEFGTLVNCSREQGETCKIRCPGGKLMNEDVVCLTTGFWTVQSLRLQNFTGGASSENIKWITISNCTCPSPYITENYVAREDCSRKRIGEKCNIMCKTQFSTIGNKYVVCLTTGNWSPFPECIIRVCPPPKTRPGMLVQKNCSYKQIGESCNIQCSENLIPYPEKTIECLPGGRWSKMPFCTCRPPLLSAKLLIDGNCNDTKVGRSCRLKCAGDRKVLGSNYIVCSENGSWSDLPTCRNQHCIQPRLPEYLSFVENCSWMESGKICPLICKTGGTFLGKSSIKCKWGKWSSFPLCTCPNIVLPSDLEAVGNCTSIKPGRYCKLSCKDKSTVLIEDSIQCQENTTWTTLPSCSKKRCEDPELTPHLRAKYGCSKKSVGEFCELICSQNQSLIGSSVITCLNTSKWSSMPSCGCSKPNLQHPLKAKNNCDSTQPGNKCELQCNRDFKLVGESSIICLNDGNWSNLPVCERIPCEYPDSSPTLILVGNCVNKKPGDKCHVKCKEGGKTIDKSYIECFQNRTWSRTPNCTCPVPQLRNFLDNSTNCDSIVPGGRCYLKCLNKTVLTGDNFIKCKADTTWSAFPDCKSNFCEKPDISDSMIAVGCLNKVPGEVCSLTCKQNGKIVGNSSIQCTASKSWTVLPECVCPTPVLRLDIENKTNCENRKQGQSCEVSCKGGKKLIGNASISCKKNFEWSSQPQCRTRNCSQPYFSRNLLDDSNKCSSKAVGENCTLQCIGGRNIIGSDTIVCLNETHWSASPDCTCPFPNLSQNLEVVGDCVNKSRGETCMVKCSNFNRLVGNDTILCGIGSKWSSMPLCQIKTCPDPKKMLSEILQVDEECSSKSPGDTCKLSCVQKGKILGSNIITCVNGTEWTSQPSCTCPPPKLSGELSLKEDCNFKKINETCKVECSQNSTVVGQDIVVCENDTKWSAFPRCNAKSCTEPTVPSILKLVNNCSSLLIGQECHLQCSEGGKVIGKSSITCLADLSWTSYPNCSCPTPEIIRVNTANCRNKIPGESCSLSCKDSLSSITRRIIICKNDTKWNARPECRRRRCPNLSARHKWTVYVGICNNKRAGDKCYLRCAQNGTFFEGKNYTYCEKNGTWSVPAPCSCNKPQLGDMYEIRDNCDEIYPENKCKISCKNGNEMTQDYIVCQNSTKWSRTPSCDSLYCPPFPLPENMKMLDSDCKQVKRGQKCKVACENSGIVRGSNEVLCKPAGFWEDVPRCICPEPAVKQEYIYDRSCKTTSINEFCQVRCKNTNETFYIQCALQKTYVWTALPPCGCRQAASLNPYVQLEATCQLKNTFASNETCRVSCIGKRTLLSGAGITCVGNDIWTHSPFCSCLPPPPSSFVKYEGCEGLMPNTSCIISCIHGKINNRNIASYLCDVHSNWPPAPICSCSRPALNPHVQLEGSECSSKLIFEHGYECRVSCGNGGHLVLGSVITCHMNGSWTPGPYCSCPPPQKSPTIKYHRCQNVLPNGNCTVSCIEGKINEDNRAAYTCDLYSNWGPEPVCFCSVPKLNHYVSLFGEKCSNKRIFKPEDECPITCTNGGVLFVSNVITCNTNGTWTPNPFCSCPPLLESSTLRYYRCENVVPTGNCTVSCIKGKVNEDNKTPYVCDAYSNWTPKPFCFCPVPSLNSHVSLFEGECLKKRIFEHGYECPVFCSNGGILYVSNVITCNINGSWTPNPYCSCPPPPESPVLKYDGCESVVPTGNCSVSCIEGKLNDENRGAYLCDGYSNWGHTPTCFCLAPRLKLHVRLVEGKCLTERVFQPGYECPVFCNNGGVLFENNVVRCQENGTWTKSPYCSCGPPPESLSLKYIGCNATAPEYSCEARCIYGKVSETNNTAPFLCDINSNWGRQPNCFCSTPSLNPHVTLLTRECRTKTMFSSIDKCNIFCSNNGTIFNANEIFCSDLGVWYGNSARPDKNMPLCGCSIPAQQGKYVFHSSCKDITPNATCEISCNFQDPRDRSIVYPVLCNKNSYWEGFPLCGCLRPILHPNVKFYGYDATRCRTRHLFKVSERCQVFCIVPSYNIQIECRPSGQWSPHHACVQ